MNEIEKVRAHLSRKYADASIALTAPAEEGGVWWLDVISGGKHLVIEWSLATGFGITTPDADSFGEKADESYSSAARIINRIDQLLVNDERTSPPLAVLLARLRESRGVTQQELASRLGLRQASISGLERREDLQLSTLRKVIGALGGCIQIYARFPEGRFTLEGSVCEGGAFEIVPTQEISSEPGLFVQLKNCGMIERAMGLASRVKEKRSVIEMVE
jgi:transcriptional regulator with XRE-family HTH domain